MRPISRLLILLSALAIPCAASAQTGATFSYDASGNRTTRTLAPAPLWSSSAASSLTDSPGALPASDTALAVKTASKALSDRSRATGRQHEPRQVAPGAIPRRRLPSDYDRSKQSESKQGAHADKGSADRSGALRADPSLPVTEIPYDAAVTASGGRIYSVPLRTAADIDFAPTLALTYNSQGGSGVAGWGWSLSGLSAVTLRGKTLWYDGEKAPVSRTSGMEMFSLDGVPLVGCTIPELQDDYPLETASGFIAVKRSADGSTFTALRPDGVTAIYGTAGDLRPRTSLTDRFGNKVTFSYDLIDGEDVLANVYYGFDASGENPVGHMRFDYAVRSDTLSHWCAGLQSRSTRLLKNILSFDGDSTLCTYALTHRDLDGVTELTGIHLWIGDERCSPLLVDTPPDVGDVHTPDFEVIDYATMPYYIDPSEGPVTHRRAKLIPGSFSDGFYSHLAFNPYAPSDPGNRWSGYPSDGQIFITPASDRYLFSPDPIFMGEGFQSLDAADLDGDGADELLRVSYGESCIPSGVELDLTIFDFDRWGYLDTLQSTVNIPGTYTYAGRCLPTNHIFLYGDFSGGGAVEMLSLSYESGAVPVEHPEYAVVGFRHSVEWPDSRGREAYVKGTGTLPFTLDEYSLGRLLPMDIDADGKTELCFYEEGTGLKVFKYDTALSSFSLSATVSGLESRALEGQHYITDLNADGYPDIVTTPVGPDDDTLWPVFEFTGGAFTQRTMDICGTPALSDRILFMDVDRDGYADMVRMTASGCFVHRNVCGTIQSEDDCILARGLSGATFSDIIPAATVNWKGTSHFVLVSGDEYLFCRYTDPAPSKHQIRCFHDSHGLKRTDWFADLSEHDLCSVDTEREYPSDSGFFRETLPLQVLEADQMHLPDGAPITAFTLVGEETRSYTDPVLSTRGLGFCGFGSTTVINTLTGTGDDPDFTTVLTDPSRGSVTTRIITREGVTCYEWDSHRTAHGYPSPRQARTLRQDFLQGTLTDSHTREYDRFDTPLTSSVRYGRCDGEWYPWAWEWYEMYGDEIVFDDIAREQWADSTVSSVEHVVTPSLYLTGLVTQSRTIRTKSDRPGEQWQSRTTISYDTAGVSPAYLPVETVEYTGTNGNNKVMTKRYSWTSKGKQLSGTQAPYNSTAFVGESFTYDAAGRHLASSTDRLGHTTSYSDYDLWGNARTVTDFRGRTEQHIFDRWGNPTSSTDITGTVTTYARSWTTASSAGPAASSAVIRTAVSTAGLPTEVTFEDALGRTVKSGDERMDGTYRYVSTEYNARGDISRQSLPYKSSSASDILWTESSYDTFGRVTSVVEPSGRSTVTSYADSTVTVTHDGVTSVKAYDACGMMVSATDAGGTIGYRYRPDGQMDTLIAPGGARTVFSFDVFGRRTAIDDPGAGRRTFSESWSDQGKHFEQAANSNGYVKSWYDKYGRIYRLEHSTIGVGSYTTDYTYNSHGLLTRKESSNGTLQTFSYDSFDRPVTITERADTVSFSKRLTYNASGSQIASVRYTSMRGIDATETRTYSHGTPVSSSLTDNASGAGTPLAVISHVSENDLGLPTRITTAGMTRSYGFDQYGNQTRRTMTVTSTGQVKAQTLYSYRLATGDILTRHDTVHGRIETMTYDALNRLSSVTDAQVGVTSAGYATVGGGITGLSGLEAQRQMTASYADSDHPSRQTSGHLAPESLSDTYTAYYTSYDRVRSISVPGGGISFTYNADHRRVKSSRRSNFETKDVRYYLSDCYELQMTPTDTTELLYFGGTSSDAPMVMEKVNGGTLTAYNIGRDHIGTVTHVFTAGGALVAEYSYDPWGRPRDPSTHALTGTLSAPEPRFHRGFAGHEWIAACALWNMNARLYDPAFGVFLSPDPYVQAPDFTQNLNRYCYCLGNPLKYTDETGELFGWDDALAALIGGTFNWIANGCQFTWDGLCYFGIGAVAGVASIYASPVAISGVMEATNSVIRQGRGNDGNWSLQNVNPAMVLMDGAMGLATSYVGGKLSSQLSKSLGKITSNIPGKAWEGLVNRGLAGAATGFIMGGGISALNQLAQYKETGQFDWSAVWKSGGNAAALGFATGGISGMAEGIAKARVAKENPWALSNRDLNPSQVSVEYKSLGARSKPFNAKKVSSDYLKQNGIDPHLVKCDYLGRRAEISRYDLYLSKEGQIIIFGKGGAGEGIPTAYWIPPKVVK